MIFPPLEDERFFPRSRPASPELSAGKANVIAIILGEWRDTRRRVPNIWAPTPSNRKRDRDHFSVAGSDSTICTTKLFFSAVGVVVDPAGPPLVAGVADSGAGKAGAPPTIEEIAARNSVSRLEGRSTRMPRRCSSGIPFAAVPPRR